MLNNEEYARKLGLPQLSSFEQSSSVNNVLSALSASASSTNKNLPSSGSAFSAPGLLIPKINDAKSESELSAIKDECSAKNETGNINLTGVRRKSNESIIFIIFFMLI